eukprot:g82951.t1
MHSIGLHTYICYLHTGKLEPGDIANIESNQADEEDWTPLQAACYDGKASAVRTLLDLKADPNPERKTNGCTPVYLASEKGHAQILQELLEAGGNPKQAAQTGATPVYIASANGHAECLKLLLAAGADPKQPKGGKTGSTPIHIARANEHSDCLEILLAAIAPPKETGKQEGGESPNKFANEKEGGTGPTAKKATGDEIMKKPGSAWKQMKAPLMEGERHQEDTAKVVDRSFELPQEP